MSRFNVPAYNPTPIESPQNALMRGLEMQRAQQGNALQNMQLQAFMQRQQQAQSDQALMTRLLGMPVEGQMPQGMPGPGAPMRNQGVDPQTFLRQGGSMGGLEGVLGLNKALAPQPRKVHNMSAGGRLVGEDGTVIAEAQFKPEPQKLPQIGELQALRDGLPQGDPRRREVQAVIDNQTRAPKYASGGGGSAGPAAAPPPKPMTAFQEAKRRDQIARDYASANTVINNMSDVLDSATAVKTSKGLPGATGIQAYIPSIPDSEAAKAEVRLQNLEGKVTNLGKAAASASGAVGPMAVQEWKIVRDMVAAIDPKKGEKALLEQIALVESATEGAVARLRDAYDKHYAEDFERFPQFATLAPDRKPKSPAGGGAPVKVTSDADYAALPPGTRFVTPDGKTGTKR